MKTTLFVIGSSGQAKVALDIIECQGHHSIAGLLDDFRSVDESTCGYPVLGTVNDIGRLSMIHASTAGVVAIGDNWKRAKVVQRIISILPNFEFVTLVHPAASLSRSVKVGKGTVIMPGVTINRDAVLGDFCIANTNSSVDHDSRIGNYCSLAPGACTGGHVHIGDFSAVMIGACVSNAVKIGKHSVIGAGATVLNDIADYQVAHGTPAKCSRERKQGEPYL